MTPALTDLIERLRAAGRIADDDVTALRGEVYGADAVADDELTALLALDAALAGRTPAWANFLYDVMSDALLRQTDPQDYVSDGEAALVMRAMGETPAADGALVALARVIAEADQVPASLESYGLAKAKAAVARAGAVSAAHVELLRRLVFAGGGEGALGVTRAEADALFDVNDACHEAANDPAWADFFAKAIADSLTAVSPFQAPGRAQAMADETWLDQKPTLGGFLGAMAAKPDVGGFARDVPDILDPFRTEAHEWDGAEAAIERDEASAADITDDEARWLVGRLSQGRLNEAERELIAALKGQAGLVSPLLQPLLGGAPATPAEQAPAVAYEPAQPTSYAAPAAAAPVFGHRKAAPG